MRAARICDRFFDLSQGPLKTPMLPVSNEVPSPWMLSFKRPSSRSAVALVGGICLATIVSFAWGQEQGAPADLILARKTLMSVIARNMYPLDEMVYTGKVNLPRGRA